MFITHFLFSPPVRALRPQKSEKQYLHNATVQKNFIRCFSEKTHYFSWRFHRKIVNLPSDINYLTILPWVNILTPSPIGASNASSDKKAEECESDFDKWIYVLKHMEALERMPFTAQKKIFKRLAELADSRCLSQEEQEKYDESLKAADDYYGVLMSYYMNGIDEGVAKGEARGIAKGEARGSYHKSLDIAKKMLLKDMDDESIMELTGLTQEQLHQLKS